MRGSYMIAFAAPVACALASALWAGAAYPVIEVAPDGRAPQWSARGAYAAFETGTGADRVTHVLAMDGVQPREVTAVRGWGLVFSPTESRVAYLAPNDTGAAAHIVVRDLDGLGEETRDDGGLLKLVLAFSSDGRTLFALGARPDDENRTDLFVVRDSGGAAFVAAGEGVKSALTIVPGGRFLLFELGGRDLLARTGTGEGTGGARGAAPARPASFGILDLTSGKTEVVNGLSPVISSDGSTLAYVGRDGDSSTIVVRALAQGSSGRVVVKTVDSLAAPALSPSGATVAFQMMRENDWDIYTAPRAPGAARRITREAQHDLLPRFIDERRLFAVMGEAHRRRSFVYDVETGERTRLFSNNSAGTIVPEYEWSISPDGSKILTVAGREGDGASPAHGVYLTDLSGKVSLRTCERACRRASPPGNALARSAMGYDVAGSQNNPRSARVVFR